MKNNTNIQYRQVGDYLIPNLTLPPEEASIRLGKWGMLHKYYLLKHKKVFFTTLLANGKLYQHCAKIENQARNMFYTLVEQMKTTEGVSKELKEKNQMEWVWRLDNIRQSVTEIIYSEIIYR